MSKYGQGSFKPSGVGIMNTGTSLGGSIMRERDDPMKNISAND